MNFNVAVPFLAPLENFQGMISKVEVEWLGKFVFTDNSPNSDLKNRHFEDYGARVFYHPENIGIGRAWNYALREDVDFTLILSTSIRFNNGFSEFIEGVFDHVNKYGLLTWEAWHLLVIGRKSKELVGLIDENFYPAYYEDNDYMRRLKLAGIHESITDRCGVLPKYDAPVTCVGDAVALKTGLIQPKFDKLLNYYVQKWGGHPSAEKFIHPFNDETKDLSFWECRSLEETKEYLEALN